MHKLSKDYSRSLQMLPLFNIVSSTSIPVPQTVYFKYNTINLYACKGQFLFTFKKTSIYLDLRLLIQPLMFMFDPILSFFLTLSGRSESRDRTRDLMRLLASAACSFVLYFSKASSMQTIFGKITSSQDANRRWNFRIW